MAAPFARHPSQLYEAALEGLVLFLVLRLLTHYAKQLRAPGLIAGTFVAGYGLSRIIVEFYREPDAHIGYLAGNWLTMGMILSLPMVLVGLWAIVSARMASGHAGAMTALRERLVRLIEATGPLSVADYMAHCLFDPEQGYYTTREPFGVSGDFTTAPEISQMFGELVAIWLYNAWTLAGRPENGGSGRDRPRARHADERCRPHPAPARSGFRAADAFRSWSRPVRACARSSARPLARQPARLRLARFQWPRCPTVRFSSWATSFSTPCPSPSMWRPIGGWRETHGRARRGGKPLFLRPAQGYRTGSSCRPVPIARPRARSSSSHRRAARSCQGGGIAARIGRHGGAGLFFDYGYEGPALGDTLQALRRHAPDDVLAHPGEADLNFACPISPALAQAARQGKISRRGSWIRGGGGEFPPAGHGLAGAGGSARRAGGRRDAPSALQGESGPPGAAGADGPPVQGADGSYPRPGAAAGAGIGGLT